MRQPTAHHIFLSYSRKDIEVMRRVRADLRARGFQIWTDERLEPGTPAWEQSIARAIEQSGCLIVILSPDAKASEWVGRELSYAEEQGLRVFPVLIRGDGRSAVPFRLTSTQRVDARDNYTNAIASLVTAISNHLDIKTSSEHRSADLNRQHNSQYIGSAHNNILSSNVRPPKTQRTSKLLGKRNKRIITIALVIAFLVAALLILNEVTIPKPNITLFEVNSTRVAQGEFLTLHWTANDATQFTISANGTPVLTGIGTEGNQAIIETEELSGSVTISLEASNGRRQTSASQVVHVYQPLEDITFNAEPAELVRYVVQNLTLSWNVPGAVRTRITGLENFNATPVDEIFGQEGSLKNLLGIPSNPITLTLYSQDEVGNTNQTVLEIPVVNPECTPVGNTVTLYAGPDIRNEIVSIVSSGTILVIDAQDGSGAWLRAQLSNKHGWGLVSEFTCAQNFSLADLQKEIAVPTVPPIPQASS